MIMNNRLKISRQWLIVAVSYYLTRAAFIIFPESDKSTPFQNVVEVLQAFMMFFIVIVIVHSYKFDELKYVKYLLFIQAVQMMLSNFSVYKNNFDATKGEVN